ncbi:hypothetical protein VPH35_072421 [Triticum aestivum]
MSVRLAGTLAHTQSAPRRRVVRHSYWCSQLAAPMRDDDEVPRIKTPGSIACSSFWLIVQLVAAQVAARLAADCSPLEWAHSSSLDGCKRLSASRACRSFVFFVQFGWLCVSVCTAHHAFQHHFRHLVPFCSLVPLRVQFNSKKQHAVGRPVQFWCIFMP